MSGAARPDARSSRIELAHEPPFGLGAAWVRPALGEVEAAGQRIRLQPRVMQVLVCLAQAEGEAVSRDDLVERCWAGLAVGEDAINRCVQRLRRLERETPGAFQIETLPRVGYRLLAAGRAEPTDIGAPAAPGAAEAVSPGERRRAAAWLADRLRARRGAYVALAALLVVLTAALAALGWRVLRPAPSGGALAPVPAAASGAERR